MKNQDANQVFDFTSSFERTLARFEQLASGSKTDYERSKQKREQRLSEQKEITSLALGQN